MHKVSTGLVIVIASLLVSCIATAMEPPAFQVQVRPPFSDRRFPYIAYEQTWFGTPARSDDVAVPNVFIVYGENEHKEVIAEAGKIGFYLGNWVTDIGFNVEQVKHQRMPPLFLEENRIPSDAHRHLIVVGNSNDLKKIHRVGFEESSVIHKQVGDSQLLFVGGKTRQEAIKAIRYLADVRLNFKSGAYKTFFSFIRLRGYIETENYVAASGTIGSPVGLSACGRNMTLAASTMAQAPEKVRRHIQHRNELLYEKLPRAVNASDRALAITVWQKAMKTCYDCHQGREDFPRLRRFKPPGSIHAKHQRIAAEFGFGDRCEACHFEETKISGYD